MYNTTVKSLIEYAAIQCIKNRSIEILPNHTIICNNHDINNLTLMRHLRDIFNTTAKIIKLKWYCYTYCLTEVKANGLLLSKVINQTDELCHEAVKQNGLSLKYVTYKLYHICLSAVKQNGMAIEYVPINIIDDLICDTALKSNGCAMVYINNMTHDRIINALTSNPKSITLMMPALELYIYILDLNPLNLQYINQNDQTYELCMYAVLNNSEAIKYVKNQTIDMCIEAYCSNKNTFKYFDKTIKKLIQSV